MEGSFLSLPSRGLFFVPTLILGLYAAFLVNWHSPVALRFTSPLLNIRVLMAALLLPLPAFAFIVWKWRGTARITGAILVALIGIPSVCFAGLVASFESPGVTSTFDPGFEHRHELKVGQYCVAVYRTNGGATTAYGVVVRQELPLFLNLRSVREIYRSSHGGDATVQIIGPDTITINVPYHEPPEVRMVHLQPFLAL